MFVRQKIAYYILILLNLTYKVSLSENEEVTFEVQNKSKIITVTCTCTLQQIFGPLTNISRKELLRNILTGSKDENNTGVNPTLKDELLKLKKNLSNSKKKLFLDITKYSDEDKTKPVLDYIEKLLNSSESTLQQDASKVRVSENSSESPKPDFLQKDLFYKNNAGKIDKPPIEPPILASYNEITNTVTFKISGLLACQCVRV